MNPNKQQEEEIKLFLTEYWNSYLRGDLETFASFLADEYKNIGGTLQEIFHNKKEMMAYTKAVNYQMVGTVAMRNKEVRIFPLDPYIMAHEYLDLYIKPAEEWVFYGKLRLSNILQKIDGQWKVLHQHGSFPDAKAEEGESIGFKKVSKENQELKDAIKRRTVELENKTRELELSMAELKDAQSQLIHAEKLASLGQLAAGIAHEIKNPMNFVNNFSELSLEYVTEIQEELEKLEKNDSREAIASLLQDVEENLKKIHQHGTRADGILKSMLLHSRGGNGIMEPTNVNELIKEYVNLAFHGMRAGKSAINVKIDYQLDANPGVAEINPEDFSRVILNLCNNAFDAMRSKLLKEKTANYLPVLKLITKVAHDTLFIGIEDNGPGVPDTIKNKLFEPFFTTKKGTEGTGLGLSITHDIIKTHGGKIQIASQENEYTRFEISIPLTQKNKNI